MRRRLWFVPLLALLAAGVIWWRQAPAAPAGTWRVGDGTDFRHGRNFDGLPPESPIRLSLHVAAPTYVYVFSHSNEDGTLLLWPSDGLQTDVPQPLPAGQTVLPGRHAAKDLAWTTRSGIRAGTTFVVIAAAQPVPELEQLRSQLRHWSNSVFPDGALVVTQPVSGAAAGPPRSTTWPSPLLERAAATGRGAVSPNGPLQADTQLPAVWVGSWRVIETKA
jgi:hypothetical protein